MTTTVIEMVTYQIKRDTRLDHLSASHEAVNQLISQQPGFLYRSVSKDANDLWHDIVYWQDMACAQAAGDVFMASKEGQYLCSLVDMDSCHMKQMPVEAEAMMCEG